MKKIRTRLAAIALAGAVTAGTLASGIGAVPVAADTSYEDVLAGALFLGILDEMSDGMLSDALALEFLEEAYVSTQTTLEDKGSIQSGPGDVSYSGTWISSKSAGFGLYVPSYWNETSPTDQNTVYQASGYVSDTYTRMSIQQIRVDAQYSFSRLAYWLEDAGCKLIGKCSVNGIDGIAFTQSNGSACEFGFLYYAPNDSHSLYTITGYSDDDDRTVMDIIFTLCNR